MNKDVLKRLSRHIWGWFTVCVWIVGVPNVCRLSIVQVQGAAVAAKCLFADCSAMPEGEILGTMSEEEFKELTVLQKARSKGK
jgi:hypothetical protein